MKKCAKATKRKSPVLQEMGERHYGYRNLEQAIIQLEGVIDCFRFEGVPVLGKNLKAAGRAVDVIEDELTVQLQLEESVIFKFVNTCIPKLEPITMILKAEHKNVRRGLKAFKFVLWEFLNEKRGTSKSPQEVIEAGTYLAYLLKDMVMKKKQALYQVMECQLNARENAALSARIEEWKVVFGKRNDGGAATEAASRSRQI